MKSSLLLAILSLTLAFNNAWAKPRAERRSDNQEKRIEQGKEGGSLTEGETKRLEAQQNRIDNVEERAQADGKMSGKEKAKINHMQNRASRNIFRAKHNGKK